ncbi:sirohydrochlorin chelatase [Nocardiopsis baichengensis]|uniref:sirohydrochlorin chelatase n=1 Tax=Nocardiopsis baichengensis TaxID=280240 RepID=UPI00034B839C|nr:CbiX/SirB N-terminal domain-containing protein [Nocardiopsis baichengensis]
MSVPPTPTLLLAVHGTRDPEGARTARALARATAAASGAPVRLAFADVLEPDVGQVAAGVEGPLVVVPAFLASGYHVRVDIPEQLARAGRAEVPVAPALGADRRLVAAAAARLARAGHRAGEPVVLAGAGSSDRRALGEVERAARMLSPMVGAPVVTGYAATAAPTVAEAVAALRARGAARVAVASWLLAPGLFQARLSEAGADTVAGPLCPHPAVARVLADRYARTLSTAQERPLAASAMR